MIVWKPSRGLQLAPAVVEKIEQALAACGVNLEASMQKALTHRLMQIVADAIDNSADTQIGMPAVINHAPNGHANGHAESATASVDWNDLSARDKEIYASQYANKTQLVPPGSTHRMVANVPSNLTARGAEPQLTPVKKARGRPKGSGNKKAKAKKGKPEGVATSADAPASSN